MGGDTRPARWHTSSHTNSCLPPPPGRRVCNEARKGPRAVPGGYESAGGRPACQRLQDLQPQGHRAQQRVPDEQPECPLLLQREERRILDDPPFPQETKQAFVTTLVK